MNAECFRLLVQLKLIQLLPKNSRAEQ